MTIWKNKGLSVVSERDKGFLDSQLGMDLQYDIAEIEWKLWDAWEEKSRHRPQEGDSPLYSSRDIRGKILHSTLGTNIRQMYKTGGYSENTATETTESWRSRFMELVEKNNNLYKHPIFFLINFFMVYIVSQWQG